jgi:streptogramin lyase
MASHRSKTSLSGLIARAFILASLSLSPLAAHAAAPATLHGHVASAEEGAMEGVLVTVKKEGSTIALTVVSDARGEYAFPAGRLGSGKYAVKIRAVGYDLDGASSVDVVKGHDQALDLKLVPTRDLAAQLSSAEWVASAPGTEKERNGTFLRCVNCHTVERIFRSKYTTEQFQENILPRMFSYANNSIPMHPQVAPPRKRADATFNPSKFRALAERLSRVNLHDKATWDFPLRKFPRPKGKETRVVITTYDLPRQTMEPHDTYVDKQGIVWASNFGEQTLIRLDPKTGSVKEYPVPLLRPGSPTGSLGLRADEDGNLWMGNMYQAQVLKIDRKTGKMRSYPLPKELLDGTTQLSKVTPMHSKVDGKVWLTNGGMTAIHRVDVKTGKYDTFQPFKDRPKGESHNLYDVLSDKHNNGWFVDFSKEHVGVIDAKTGKIQIWEAPTKSSRPRRGMIDAQGRFWYGGFGASLIGMFDTNAKTFKEWKTPSPFSGLYDAVADRNGDVWAGGQLSDRVVRLDPKTGEMLEYLLPEKTDIRHAFVDNAPKHPTFWVGNNHGAAIIEVEPLD